jgi:starch synthase (maltosyl-transferring)
VKAARVAVYNTQTAPRRGRAGRAARDDPAARIAIHDVRPLIDCGRYAPKRCVGDTVEVSATIFRDGHDILEAAIRYRPAKGRWREALMHHVGNDRWIGHFPVDRCGRWEYTIQAWTDRLASWRDEVRRKVAGGQADLDGELSEGAALYGADDLTVEEGLARTDTDRTGVTSLPAPLRLDVDRERARFGSWYELFPRSWGGFKGVAKQLPRLAELGFDVLYLPPIHPIGTTNRKGRNNALKAGPRDPGSPWAIGGDEGGHTAIHPELGTLADFDRLVAAAGELGMDVCLDFAIQCSPDHPWLKEHPEWFHRRPDGTLKYAENPPKRYQDIYNVNFESEDWRGLWEALRDIVLFWVGHGVKIFRVDNPHTKPITFWEWLIAEVRGRDPEVIFLAEAFTRPAMMRTLAKVGFNQSYTYFTWKNSKWELVDYLTELTGEMAEYYRPNFFANTPDILHAYLQRGGRPAFEARLGLAATLSPTYGIYSGYESCEDVPVREGSEEYLDSEKYEARRRALDGELLPLIARVNWIRRQNPALQRLPLTFLETENEQLIAYAKQADGNCVVTCVNVDPFAAQEGLAMLPASLGLPPVFHARELLSDRTFDWRIGRNYLRLEPGQSHILRVA